MNYSPRWRSGSGVLRDCVNRIRLWPLRRDDHSGVLIGASGQRRSDWPARLLANDEARESIDSPRAKRDRLHVCKGKWQLATSVPFLFVHRCAGLDTLGATRYIG